MKQQITLEQLEELSPKAKQQLKTWFFAREIEPCLLSVGQMIELLQTFRPDKRFKGGYRTTIEFYQEGGADYDWWDIVPDRLCDDLWEAVKKELS